MTTTNDPIAELERTTGSNWSAIKAAAAAAMAKRRTLVAELTKVKLVPPDSTFVMFGSLARDEVTAGSDLDWTLLIDGQSDTRHVDVTKAIKVLVEKDYKPPGPTALFGTMAFSHEHVVAEFIRNFGANAAGKVIFDAYDRFLTILGDQAKRERLEKLGADDAGSDPVFTEARDVGTAFQDGLTELFFKRTRH